VSVVEVTPEELNRDFFYYYVDKVTRSTARCRGCDKQLEQNTLCLRTHLICIIFVVGIAYKADNSRYARISFCANENCLTKGLERYKNQVRYGQYKEIVLEICGNIVADDHRSSATMLPQNLQYNLATVYIPSNLL
jgi:hypothetical protein